MALKGTGVSPRIASQKYDEWRSGVEDLVLRSSPLLDQAQKNGNMVKNFGGPGVIWPVRKAVTSSVDVSHMGTITFTNSDKLDDARLQFPRAFAIPDAWSDVEEIQSKGGTGLSAEEVRMNFLDSMDNDALLALGADLFKAQAGTRVTGLLSFLNYVAANQVATDEFATEPSSTYAGISTDYDVYVTPASSMSVDVSSMRRATLGAGVWSPRIVNVTVQKNAVNQTWAANATEALRRGIAATLFGNKDRADLILLDPASFNQLKTLLEVYNQKQLMPTYAATKYGFGERDPLWFDGAMIMPDDFVPATDPAGKVLRGIGINTKRFKLKCAKGSLFVHEQQREIQQLSWKHLVTFWGEMCVDSPAYFFSLSEIN